MVRSFSKLCMRGKIVTVKETHDIAINHIIARTGEMDGFAVIRNTTLVSPTLEIRLIALIKANGNSMACIINLYSSPVGLVGGIRHRSHLCSGDFSRDFQFDGVVVGQTLDGEIGVSVIILGNLCQEGFCTHNQDREKN